jgi:NifU-like protein involved in Fe-S cluster formation
MDYSSEVVQRFAAATPVQGPFGSGRAGARTAAAEAEDKTLNVWVRFEVEVSQGIIDAAGFQVFGCPHCVAAASWVAEWLRGRPADALHRVNARQVQAALQVPTEKLGKLLRIEDAVAACWQRLEQTPSIESKEG